MFYIENALSDKTEKKVDRNKEDKDTTETFQQGNFSCWHGNYKMLVSVSTLSNYSGAQDSLPVSILQMMVI